MKKFLFLGLLILAVFGSQIYREINENGPLGSSMNVVIPRGASVKTVAVNLENNGVIKHPLVFRVYAKLKKLDKHLKAGEYQFSPYTSMRDVLNKIASGEVYYRKFTIPEGLTSGQIMYMISAYPDFSGEITLEIKEGELLPETYSFELGASRDSILQQAKDAMLKTVDEIWKMREDNLPISDMNEMVTLASIIEKETGISEERTLVSSVFVNRLRKGMKLQTDPTVIYSLTEGENAFGRKLSKADLQIDSPYNTYRYKGLPPGPICNPGRASLLAAVRPEITNYLYFVATGNGGHNFAKSLNEHNQNVKSYRKKH